VASSIPGSTSIGLPVVEAQIRTTDHIARPLRHTCEVLGINERESARRVDLKPTDIANMSPDIGLNVIFSLTDSGIL
jgi:hypothetical protein